MWIVRIALERPYTSVVLALLLAFSQMPFANSTFEFGKVWNFEGTVVARPYPMLLVARPGAQSEASPYLLAAQGKHGIDVSVFDAKQVRLQGTLIYRDGKTMVEVVPATIALTNAPAGMPANVVNLGPVTLTGEIVDSKCYLGVMNPGNGKAHRDCAARCLSGGIPPLFVTSDGGQQLLLVDNDGSALAHDALREFIAERVTVTGTLLQRGETQMLKIDRLTLQHGQ